MKDLILPEEMREFFQRPFGEVIQGDGLIPAEEVKRRLRSRREGERIIAIGDVTARNLRKVGVLPTLTIVDRKTKRGPEEDRSPREGRVLQARNPPGMITQDLWERIREGLKEEGTTILVEGEEDLAVLPAVLEAELDTLILYGQPDVGMVMLRVTQEKKEDAAALVKVLYSE
jgi:hypothetical protein